MKNRPTFFWLAWVVVVAGLVLASLATAQKGEQAEVLLQAALHKEMVDGNLDEAIQLYKTIVANHATNRAVAAKALVQMGQCYEKLGKTEARKAYEQVLRDYADQPEAAEARARLAALAAATGADTPATMLTRRVWAGPEVDSMGGPSPDGRYLSFVDWSTGDLAIRDLATGENRRLTKKGSWFDSEEYAEFSIMSPDGQQIAYAWFNEQFYELRVIGRDGSPPRVLYRNEELTYVQPSAWSPDGKHIVTVFSRADRTNQIVLLSVADGSVQVLKTFDWRYPQKPALSPDGRYIVYSFPPKEESPERDIFLLAADGSREVPLVQHPATNDLFPVWTPDGSSVLFVSDRAGTWDAWAIRVADGKPQGSAELVKRDIGRIFPVGLTRKGSFYYGVRTGMDDIYVARLDLAAGKVLAGPVEAAGGFLGSNASPDWSPDGRYLAYISQRGPSPFGLGSGTLAIHSVETGEERQLRVKLNVGKRPFAALRWSPDGGSFLVRGHDAKGRRGLYRVHAETGDVTPVVQSEPGTRIEWDAWSSDGKALFYVRTDTSSQTDSIRVRNLETGQDTELYRVVAPLFIGTLVLSPDGRQLAFRWFDQKSGATALKVIPASGGEPRELLRVDKPDSISWNTGLAWTPDGSQVLFGRRRGFSAQYQTVELWRISAEGGEPQKFGLAMDQLRDIRLHPDGQRIAFAAGKGGGEIWVMENFLPALKAQR